MLEATVTKKKNTLTAKAVIAVLVVGLIACGNLDIPAKALASDDNLIEAIFCYQIMTSTNSLLGLNNWRLSEAYMRLASCYSRMGRNAEAVSTSLHAVNIMSGLPGDHASSICVLDAQRGDFMRRAKDYPSAENLCKSAISRLDKEETANPSAKAYALSVLLDTYMAWKKYPEAEATARKLIPIDDDLQKTTDLASYGGRDRIVEIDIKTGKLKDALAMGQEAISESKSSKDIAVLAGAYDCLGRALLASGELDAAKASFDKSIDCLTKKYGAQSQKVASWQARYKQMLQEKSPYSD